MLLQLTKRPTKLHWKTNFYPATHHNARLFQGLGHPNVRVSLHHCRLRPANGRQVVHIVHDVLDHEGQDLDSHPANVRGGHFADQRGKSLPVLEDLLNGQSTCVFVCDVIMVFIFCIEFF